ncbi:ferredoxin--NADP reductase [Homoserinibacter sp. GY 40078]|uniref:ferredoxin--NADP reductase n=1 Tax=Homoserinibacter sp. GY 40078 TaxID=2603275 RepID=UPI0011CAE4DB|nr:hypothetical protein [Homoserinibacter sp. GY 40078]TXK18842.1 hypothetical protein FVQ89_02555 [Homoserinibacter sp. GY 40078]
MGRATFTSKTHEYDDVYTFRFRQPEANYQSGMYVNLVVGALFSAKRDFSYASAPHEGELAFVAHVDTGSAFKRRLSALEPGDPVWVYRRAGHVRLPETPARPLQFIAGGVGMAPFRSLILTAAAQGGFDLNLIQVQRGDDFLYRRELEPLLTRYAPVAPEQFLAEVARAARERPESIFYVCGSSRLIKAVRRELLDAGIDRRQLMIENFF